MQTISHARSVSRPALFAASKRPEGPSSTTDDSTESSSHVSLEFNEGDILFVSNPNKPTLQGDSPEDSFTRSRAIQAAESGNVHRLAKILDRKGKKAAEQTDNVGRNLLHHAAREGQEHVVDYLLGQKMNPGSASESKKTPLHYAASVDSQGATHSVIELLEVVDYRDRSIFVNLTDAFGQTPLMYAAMAGNLDTVFVLLQAGATPDTRNWFGGTALMSAAAMGHQKIASLLLATGQVAIDRCNSNGTTALMIAAREGKPDMVKYLLRKGADPMLVDRSGYTALDLAAHEASLTNGPVQAPYQTIVSTLKTAMDDHTKESSLQTPLRGLNHRRWQIPKSPVSGRL